ncbi:hypothetical protein HPP92_010208 [Vanilla planifolia]|nr:hypothetical protein HPP92_010208 [Vanilla planifolia]
MSLVLSPVEVVAVPMAGLKQHHQVGLPDFPHGAKKEMMAVEEHGRKREDFLVLHKIGRVGYSSRIIEEQEVGEEVEVSSQSSSIGVDSSASSPEEDDGETGDEAQSKLKDEGFLASLDSLEEALPIKRGLSNFFSGKSKSFTNLSGSAGGDARDLAKPENPFNKRRRILMSCNASWKRRASCSSFMTTLLVVDEGTEEEDESGRGETNFPLTPRPNHGRVRELKKRTFKSPRSFSLSDLQFV